MTAREFVVIASQRTGSTLLVRSLDAAPGILCAGEVFHFGKNTHHREYQYPYAKRSGTLIGKLAATLLESGRVRTHLEGFYGRGGVGMNAVGFKLMISQAQRFPAILAWLERRKVAAIVLHRRNSFDAALSYCKAAMTGRYHSDRDTSDGSGRPTRVEYGEFEEYLRSCEADRARLMELSKRLDGALIAYEDMVCSWDESISSIGSKFGIPRLRVPMALEKLPDRQYGGISNEDELRARFAVHCPPD